MTACLDPQFSSQHSKNRSVARILFAHGGFSFKRCETAHSYTSIHIQKRSGNSNEILRRSLVCESSVCSSTRETHCETHSHSKTNAFFMLGLWITVARAKCVGLRKEQRPKYVLRPPRRWFFPSQTRSPHRRKEEPVGTRARGPQSSLRLDSASHPPSQTRPLTTVVSATGLSYLAPSHRWPLTTVVCSTVWAHVHWCADLCDSRVVCPFTSVFIFCDEVSDVSCRSCATRSGEAESLAPAETAHTREVDVWDNLRVHGRAVLEQMLALRRLRRIECAVALTISAAVDHTVPQRGTHTADRACCLSTSAHDMRTEAHANHGGR